MIQQTSIAAYHAVVASGVVSDMAKKVYDALYLKGPMTYREVNRTLAGRDNASASYHKRLSELQRDGLAEPIPGMKRVDPDTKQKNRVWRVTPNMPPTTKRPPLKTKAVRYREFLRELEADFRSRGLTADADKINDCIEEIDG